jgi:hypothetical protein
LSREEEQTTSLILVADWHLIKVADALLGNGVWQVKLCSLRK